MAEFLKNGFVFFDGFFNSPVLNLDNTDIEKKIKYITTHKIKNISIDASLSQFYYFKEIPFIEEVYISENISVEDLYYFKGLKRMVVNIKKNKPKIDYSKFSQLEILSIDWFNGFPNLSKNEKLIELSIWKFKPRSKSLSELQLPKGLKKLQITESNILNFEGLHLEALKEFEAHYCNSLETISGIKNFSDSLQVLILDYCRKLTEYDDLRYCKELYKLILANSGNIPSLKWLKELNQVKHFSFWNTILDDADTSPCFGIDYVSFKNQRRYNYKEEAFGK